MYNSIRNQTMLSYLMFAIFSRYQMAEQALSKELLCSTGSKNVSYLYYLAQLQLLKGDYGIAAANLKEALIHSNQVLTALTGQSCVVSLDPLCSDCPVCQNDKSFKART